MEPEISQEAGGPLAGQDANHTTGAGARDTGATQPGAGVHETGATHPVAPRAANPTRTLPPPPDATPVSVAKTSWIKDDDYWRKVTYMSATGKRPSVHTTARPLPPPNRFRRSSPVRSAAILGLVIALMIAIPVGVIVADHAASKFTLPVIPGLTQPTATPTSHSTVTPTATPKKK